ncbi:16S rRNA (uracil(1498)-N(3))-methyltransferase [Ramlibacter solisilvae]|uniref:Ribosomal RNA small subunit methyltransferase E n=1 Tax=Ramlibacter tataouinensis TaxID=94132 RepID=A0A127JTB5_9BURK|nr:16S rRNA (uracil(1498)-N(3))-methyltransferase [Ramlibacter tataouinensis]AMO23185.1 16S rRNA methyltransferase [Ramlibacter tataouinensis]
MPRLHCPAPLVTGQSLALPAGAARHVQVLRLQPGDAVTLFNGEGGEWQARIERMGRAEVQVLVEDHQPVEREAGREIHLAVGVPANERMDWLVEKATELGAASIQPLATSRSVLRLSGERARKKREHWQAIAVAACEQCGRNRVPEVRELVDYPAWLAASGDGRLRLTLSLASDARTLADVGGGEPVLALSGPEGGLTPEEQQAAFARGFLPVTLGPRVLRAETAPLALLAALALIA